MGSISLMNNCTPIFIFPHMEAVGNVGQCLRGYTVKRCHIFQERDFLCQIAMFHHEITIVKEITQMCSSSYCRCDPRYRHCL